MDTCRLKNICRYFLYGYPTNNKASNGYNLFLWIG